VKLVTHYRDPQSTTALLVRTVCASLEGEFGKIDAVTKLPSAGTQPGVGRPLVVTRFETWEIATATQGDARVRVTVFASNEEHAWDIASIIGAHIRANVGGADIRGYRDVSGPSRDYDEDFSSPISAFTAVAKMRPATLSKINPPEGDTP
jgi:hypothetical protein